MANGNILNKLQKIGILKEYLMNNLICIFYPKTLLIKKSYLVLLIFQLKHKQKREKMVVFIKIR